MRSLEPYPPHLVSTHCGGDGGGGSGSGSVGVGVIGVVIVVVVVVVVVGGGGGCLWLEICYYLAKERENPWMFVVTGDSNAVLSARRANGGLFTFLLGPFATVSERERRQHVLSSKFGFGFSIRQS